MRKTDATLLATGAVVAAAIVGSRYRPGPTKDGLWYAMLDKPSYRPSGPVIGAAWMALDATLAYAGTRLIAAPPSTSRDVALAGWGASVVGVPGYSFLMFGKHKLGAALAACLGMLAATLTTIGVGASVDKRAAGSLLPLAAWLGFATLLQEEIWRKNRFFR